MTRKYVQTTREIKNPAGDARSNRAHWRSSLEKSSIPADFVWFVEHGPDNHARIGSASRHASVYAHEAHFLELLAALEASSKPVEEPIRAVVTDVGWHETIVVEAICKAKGISAAELREILAAAEAETEDKP